MLKFNILSIVVVSVLGIGFVGCSNEAPECNDSETKELVIQITNRELVKKYGQETADLIKLSIKNIRTTNKNESVGSYKCVADIEAVNPNQTNIVPITYTSQLANDGDEFYVQVYGF